MINKMKQTVGGAHVKTEAEVKLETTTKRMKALFQLSNNNRVLEPRNSLILWTDVTPV